jgi:hypothetical protein
MFAFYTYFVNRCCVRVRTILCYTVLILCVDLGAGSVFIYAVTFFRYFNVMWGKTCGQKSFNLLGT